MNQDARSVFQGKAGATLKKEESMDFLASGL